MNDHFGTAIESRIARLPLLRPACQSENCQLDSRPAGANDLRCGSRSVVTESSAMPIKLWMDGKVHLAFGSSAGGDGGS